MLKDLALLCVVVFSIELCGEGKGGGGGGGGGAEDDLSNVSSAPGWVQRTIVLASRIHIHHEFEPISDESLALILFKIFVMHD